jgi:hypothetical protein
VTLAPTRSLATVEQTADAAAMLDGAELRLAAQHRYVLDRFKQDADVIASLREVHPEELKEAEAAVAKRLSSQTVWMRGARRAYVEATIDDAEKDGTMLSQLAAMLSSSACLWAASSFSSVMVLEVPILPFLGISVALWLILRSIRRKLDRKTERTTLPTNIDKEDAQMFWDDVVNATLLTVLQNKAIPVDLATSAVLTRGWNHTRYVASVAQELRTNHAQP